MNPGMFAGVGKVGRQPELDSPILLVGRPFVSLAGLSFAPFNASSRAVTSATFEEAINIQGAGVIEFLLGTNYATAAIYTYELEIDGVVVSSGSSSAAAGQCVLPAGVVMPDSGYLYITADGNLPFKRSCIFRHKIASGTGYLYYKYRRTA